MNMSGAAAIVTIPMMAETIRKVAAMCPNVRQLIMIVDQHEGFASLREMFQDSGEYFDDNIDVMKLAPVLFSKFITRILFSLDRSFWGYFCPAVFQWNNRSAQGCDAHPRYSWR